jgi:Ca2+-transporting ATPase
VPVQILWANIIEEGLMSVAFAFEPADRAAMRERPRDIHEDGILSREMLQFIALTVGVLCTLLLALYAALLASDLPLETLRSVMFLVVALDSLFIAFSFRKLRVPMWKIPLAANRFFIGSFAVSFALFAVVLVVPFMQTLLSYTPLPLPYLALAVGYGLVSLLVIEVGKWLFFERRASVVR